MRNPLIKYTAVGAFVSAMIVALVVVLALIAGHTGPTDEYSILLDNVSDVKFGTVVRYEGFPVGQVTAIEPEFKAGHYRFRLSIDVQEGWQFPADSVARIAASSFLAAKTVEVTGGASKDIVPPGGEIAGGPSADMFSLMADVAAHIGDVIDRVGTTAETNITDFMGNLSDITKAIEAKTPRIASDVATFTAQLNIEMEKIDHLLSDRNIEAVGNSLASIEMASGNAADASSDLKAMGAKILDLADQVHSLVTDNRKNVDKSAANMEYVLRTVAQNIDSITNNLDGASRNMNEFSRLIRQNPGLLLSGANPEADKGLNPVSGAEEQ